MLVVLVFPIFVFMTFLYMKSSPKMFKSLTLNICDLFKNILIFVLLKLNDSVERESVCKAY